jgi:hypothetical protein
VWSARLRAAACYTSPVDEPIDSPPSTLSHAEWAMAIGATAALALLSSVPMPAPVRPFWSLFFLAEYPWTVRALVVLAPLALVAAARRGLATPLARAARALTARPLATPLLLWAASFGLFWLLRESRHWGDAAYTVDILEGSGDVGPLGRYFWKEPLDRLAAMLFATAGRRLGAGAETSVALLSALAGSLFVVVLWSCSARLARTRGGRLFAFSFTLCGGLSQLFFGHVENYTLVTLAMLLFFREGLAVAEGGGSLARAGLLAALALSTHPLAGFLIAPLVALPLLRPQGTRPRELLRFAAAMVPGTLYLLAFYAFCRWLGAPALELGGNRFGETQGVFLGIGEALDARHAWDVLQNYLLALPAGALVVLLQRAAERYRGARDRSALLLACGALSFLVFACFLRGTLRRRRDWDLFGTAALPAALLASRWFARRLDGGRSSVAFAVFLVLFSLAVCGAWVASNHLYVPLAASRP